MSSLFLAFIDTSASGRGLGVCGETVNVGRKHVQPACFPCCTEAQPAAANLETSPASISPAIFPAKENIHQREFMQLLQLCIFYLVKTLSRHSNCQPNLLRVHVFKIIVFSDNIYKFSFTQLPIFQQKSCGIPINLKTSLAHTIRLVL